MGRNQKAVDTAVKGFQNAWNATVKWFTDTWNNLKNGAKGLSGWNNPRC